MCARFAFGAVGPRNGTDEICEPIKNKQAQTTEDLGQPLDDMVGTPPPADQKPGEADGVQGEVAKDAAEQPSSEEITESGDDPEQDGSEDEQAPTAEQRLASLEDQLIANGTHERDASGNLVAKATTATVISDPVVSVTDDPYANNPGVLAWWGKDPDPESSSETSMIDDPLWAKVATEQYRARMGNPNAVVDLTKLSYGDWVQVKASARDAHVAQRQSEVTAVEAINTHFAKELPSGRVFQRIPEAVTTAREIVQTLSAQNTPNSAIREMLPVVEALAVMAHIEKLLDPHPAKAETDAERARRINRTSTPPSRGKLPTNAEQAKQYYGSDKFQFAE